MRLIVSGVLWMMMASAAVSGPREDNLARVLSQCWTVGSASTDTLRSAVSVRVDLRADGTIAETSLIEATGPSQVAQKTAYEIARRAVLRCTRNADVTGLEGFEASFDYNAMRVLVRKFSYPFGKSLEI